MKIFPEKKSLRNLGPRKNVLVPPNFGARSPPMTESNSLLPLVQSCFRRLHSTETAVLKVYNDIILALDSGFITALLLLDFSSAFDCVDHSILLEVLELQFGITA